jgi:atypical dual specificity phosphatase
MWVWTLNWGEVRHDLVIGSCPRRPTDIDRIAEATGATAVLSLQTDDCRAALGIDCTELAEHASRRGLVVRNVPMRDFDPGDQRTRLPGAVLALRDLLAAGHRTYVHCTAGINRASLVVLGYLTFVGGMAVPDAMAMIHGGRPEACPYWDSYYACRGDLLEPHRSIVERRAWDLSTHDPAGGADGNWSRAEQETLGRLFGGSQEPTRE